MERCWTLSDPRAWEGSNRPGRYAEFLCFTCMNIFWYGWNDILQPRPFVVPCTSCEAIAAYPVWGRWMH
jgi:hypothetical protein